MTIERKDVEKIAKLARIRLTDSEIEAMQSSLAGIFKWVELLSEVDTTKVEPLFSVNVPSMPIRQDEINHQPITDQILQNAPDKGFDMFAVPKVVE